MLINLNRLSELDLSPWYFLLHKMTTEKNIFKSQNYPVIPIFLTKPRKILCIWGFKWKPLSSRIEDLNLK